MTKSISETAFNAWPMSRQGFPNDWSELVVSFQDFTASRIYAQTATSKGRTNNSVERMLSHLSCFRHSINNLYSPSRAVSRLLWHRGDSRLPNYHRQERHDSHYSFYGRIIRHGTAFIKLHIPSEKGWVPCWYRAEFIVSNGWGQPCSTAHNNIVFDTM